MIDIELRASRKGWPRSRFIPAPGTVDDGLIGLDVGGVAVVDRMHADPGDPLEAERVNALEITVDEAGLVDDGIDERPLIVPGLAVPDETRLLSS